MCQESETSLYILQFFFLPCSCGRGRTSTLSEATGRYLVLCPDTGLTSVYLGVLVDGLRRARLSDGCTARLPWNPDVFIHFHHFLFTHSPVRLSLHIHRSGQTAMRGVSGQSAHLSTEQPDGQGGARWFPGHRNASSIFFLFSSCDTSSAALDGSSLLKHSSE